jgi:predicted alpha/beta-fold hydrolase
MKRCRSLFVLALSGIICSVLPIQAEEQPTLQPALMTATAPAPTVTPVLDKAIPSVAFDYSCDNGLYATLCAMTSFKVPSLKAEQKIKVTVFGFKKDLEVRAMVQDHPAPLVVIFLGLASKSKDPLARLWESQLYDAGCHVMTFDSIFRS